MRCNASLEIYWMEDEGKYSSTLFHVTITNSPFALAPIVSKGCLAVIVHLKWTSRQESSAVVFLLFCIRTCENILLVFGLLLFGVRVWCWLLWCCFGVQETAVKQTHTHTLISNCLVESYNLLDII